MRTLPITKTELLKRYNKALDLYLDVFDWVTYIEPTTICSLIAGVFKISGRFLDEEKLHELYSKKIDSLKLAEGEWNEKYDIPEIIDMIYDIISENNLLFSRLETIKGLFSGKLKR